MSTSAAQKDALHRLVEALPEDRIPAARRMLGSLVNDPMRRALDEAPLDDELVTEEERREIEAALAEPGGYSSEEVRQLLGIE